MYFPLLLGAMCLSLFSYALLRVHINFAIILKRRRKLVALLLLSYRCIVTISVLWLFLTVPWVGLQCVIVVFPDQTHLLFYCMHKVCIQIMKAFAARHSDNVRTKMACADLQKYLKLSAFSSRTRFKYLVQSGLKVIKRFCSP